MIETNDTVSLIRAVDQMKPPANYLLDTFFPTMEVSAEGVELGSYELEMKSQGLYLTEAI